MLGIVQGLSAQDIADLSAFYAAQERTGGVADEAMVALGERIFRAGNAETGVPACMACHGPVGDGYRVRLRFPRTEPTADREDDRRSEAHLTPDGEPVR